MDGKNTPISQGLQVICGINAPHWCNVLKIKVKKDDNFSSTYFSIDY
jgi:hypothetical protein